MPTRCSLACIVTLLALVLCTTASPAQQEERVTPPTVTYSWSSDPGDTVGGGGSGTVTSDDGEFRFKRGAFRSVELLFEQLDILNKKSLCFGPPTDPAQFLTTDDYLGVKRCPGDATTPGLEVFHTSGCNTVTGSFTVTQMLHDYYGWPVRFASSFEQHCEGATPALHGSVAAELGTVGATTMLRDDLALVRTNRLFEFTQAGSFVESIPILVDVDTDPPDLRASDEVVRGVEVDGRGRVYLFNGTAAPVLTVFDMLKGTWEHHQAAGWSVLMTLANSFDDGYGGLALFGDFVFASDMIVSADPGGILRFDATDGFSVTRFGSESYIDVTLGLDELLYALRSDRNTVDVFDPSTVGLDTVGGPITLFSASMSALTVCGVVASDTGQLFAAECFGDIHRFDGTGISEAEIDLGGGFETTDMDITAGGEIMVAYETGKIVFTDTTLAAHTVVELPDPTAGTNIDRPGLKSVNLALVPDLPFFTDGFESGDTSAWSAAAP